MFHIITYLSPSTVALLAEGVDRNGDITSFPYVESDVALLAEGVDRNWRKLSPTDWKRGRPPRGGRG